MTAGSNSDRDYLTCIEVYRGFAACAIVFLHCSREIGRIVDWWPWGDFFELFGLGISFFFVLSGFIIYYINCDDIGVPASFKEYAFRRATRIYPYYWIVLVYVLISNNLAGYNSPSVLSMIDNFLLAPTIYANLVIGVAWTLKHEMLFYGIFGLLILNKKLGYTVLCVWGVSIFFIGFLDWFIHGYVVVFQAFNAHFFLGMAAGIVLKRVQHESLKHCLPIGCALFVIVAIVAFEQNFKFTSALLQFPFGIAFCLIIVGSVSREKNTSFSFGHKLRILGAASYAIYLTHSLFLRPLFDLFSPYLSSHPLLICLMFLLAGVIAILICITLWYLVERPLINWTRRGVRPLIEKL